MPKHLIKEAALATRARSFTFEKILTSSVLRMSDWDYCYIGWAYLKCVDNLLDENPIKESAMAFLASQRKFIDDIYSIEIDQNSLTIPEKFGYYIFSYDKKKKSHLRPLVQSMMEELEFDIYRRNKIVSRLQLDNYAIKMGEATIKYYGYFVSPGLELPQSFIKHSSLAYIYADSLMDLEEDMRVGIINIPQEDVEHFGIRLQYLDAKFIRWLKSKSKETYKYFDRAFLETKRLQNPSMKILAYVSLSRKRSNLKRCINRILTMNRKNSLDNVVSPAFRGCEEITYYFRD